MTTHSASFLFGVVALGSFSLLASNASGADLETRCATPSACFCVSTAYESMIAEKVQLFRGRARQAKVAGKYVGYVSVPLSSRAGSYFTLNAEVANRIESRLAAQYGAASVWVLNPASKDADMFLNGKNASQSDYMYMWAQVILGEKGSGEDIDFVYFTGLGDFAEYFGLTSSDQLGRLAAYFEQRQKWDADFAKAVADGKVKKTEFVSYYGLRAGAAFSAGAHDEWNLISAINGQRRKDDSKEGIARQIPIFFNGHAIEPGDFEEIVGSGNAGRCP